MEFLSYHETLLLENDGNKVNAWHLGASNIRGGFV
jgi:hypothetical protein